MYYWQERIPNTGGGGCGGEKDVCACALQLHSHTHVRLPAIIMFAGRKRIRSTCDGGGGGEPSPYLVKGWGNTLHLSLEDWLILLFLCVALFLHRRSQVKQEGETYDFGDVHLCEL